VTRHVRRDHLIISLVFVYLEMTISVSSKRSSFIFDLIFNFYTILSLAIKIKQIAPMLSRIQGYRVVYLLGGKFTRKTKVLSYKRWRSVKSKIVTLSTQHVTEFNPFYNKTQLSMVLLVLSCQQ